MYLAEFYFKYWGGREWKHKTMYRLVKADSSFEAELKANEWWKDLEEMRKIEIEAQGYNFEPNTLEHLEISEPIQ